MGVERDIDIGQETVRQQGVDEVLGPFRKFISDRPALLSLLYDVDMLPEQTVTRQGAIRLAAMCEVWRSGEEGALAAPPKPPLTVDDLAQEIRRVGGNHSLGAGALAEALMPFLRKSVAPVAETP
ncbi:hypothetical protein HFO56_23180 [Rhizobium laguerreae]|uniref:hypothetical protein n=1 Tax=Rhizobium laguerreae TaxID=1076926 RepID=UPI001C91C9BF|nr:hypothetical protein [Rhizobium laguerreae]MBY3155229.1 hypothetical protein [Rhizobium laguerreae]